MYHPVIVLLIVGDETAQHL